MNQATFPNHAVPAHRAVPAFHATNSAPATSSATSDAIVDSSEIEIDPATHLPFLKNVHFNDFNISDSLKRTLSAAGFMTPTPVPARRSAS
jgi:hypothetical protein